MSIFRDEKDNFDSKPPTLIVGDWGTMGEIVPAISKKPPWKFIAPVVIFFFIISSIALIDLWEDEVFDVFFDNEGCDMIWPHDPYQAAVYSFIAEYELENYGTAIGCFHDEYDDLAYEEVALELEQNWQNNGTALEYAQAWVDLNSEGYSQQTFNLAEVFKIDEGGLGWRDGDGPPNNQNQDCDTEQLESEITSNVSNFVIQANPNPNQSGMGCFTKYVDVFGLGIYAESGLRDDQVFHAASVLAELLDNDEDGAVDDSVLLNRLQNVSAMIPMFDYDGSPGYKNFEDNYRGQGVSAVLYAEEVDPTQTGHWGSDATVEEIMHTINHRGHANIYPDAFGFQPDSSLLSSAMDEARGGQFIAHPSSYPEDAWYHYDDETCDYGCMAIEYIYWAQVSNMGILNDTATCDGITNEWEPCSKELLESMDVQVFALITDGQYLLPQLAPDGIYNPNLD